MLNKDAALQVHCLRCDAKPSEPCVQPGRSIALVGHFHKERVELASKAVVHFPSGEDLDATDKAIITYHAYIKLADAVAANSLKLFGKEFTTRDIQIRFAQEAIIELRADGLLEK